MRELGGLAVKMPFLAIIFILGGLALMGIPGTSGFAVVVLVLLSILKAQKVIIGILAITGLILTAIYVLRAIQSIFLQELKPEYLQLEDASSVEQTPLILLALVIILLGIAPDVLTDVSITSAEYLVNLMKGM
jgi:NADH-quinone oxidoreductase subunit M